MANDELDGLFEALWPKLENDLNEIPSISGESDQPSPGSEREMLEQILDEIRGLRVTPEEQSILRAINSLAAQTKGELAYLEEKEKELTEQDAPISLEDRAIAPAREKLERLDSATRAIQHTIAHDRVRHALLTLR